MAKMLFIFESRALMNYLRIFLFNRTMIWILFLVNLAGTAYGYWWYKYQLADTPAIFMAFVPDSPTASLFFTIFLLALLLNIKMPYIEALAVVTLFKYGVWAVVMNLLVLIQEGSLEAQGYMLMVSHGGMAMEGVLFASLYAYKLRHLIVAAMWVLHDVIIDYVFGMMPIYSMLMENMEKIGYFTFWLSILSIWIGWKIYDSNKRKEIGL